jgi:hypothetical protein
MCSQGPRLRPWAAFAVFGAADCVGGSAALDDGVIRQRNAAFDRIGVQGAYANLVADRQMPRVEAGEPRPAHPASGR